MALALEDHWSGPLEGLTLADKQAVNAALLACGATISEMTCVRRHFSSIKGGPRDVEFLLALALPLAGTPGGYALADDTDGVDGAEEIADAILIPDTLARAWAQGMNPRRFLDNNDAHSFFRNLGDAVITRPTLTNVNDFRAILIA